MNAERKWTPGPWEMVSLSGYGGPYAIRMATPEGSRHPTHYGVQTIGNEANAHLIAAAPDMYEALKTLDSIERGMQGWHEDAKAEAWVKARAALSKAEGR